MARKIVVRNDNDEIWVIDLDAGKVKELTDANEHKKMMKSLRFLKPRIRVQNAVFGDDITKEDLNTGHELVDV